MNIDLRVSEAVKGCNKYFSVIRFTIFHRISRNENLIPLHSVENSSYQNHITTFTSIKKEKKEKNNQASIDDLIFSLCILVMNLYSRNTCMYKFFRCGM